MKFLWFCAGANTQVLLREDCYLDRDRYAAMGVMVLITAFTAALAGGYAFYTVFQSIDLALLFGLFWGVTIGSMDRYFIMSTRKARNFSFRETGIATLRLIMACLIAFTMAKPLELAIFNSEIQAKIEHQQEQAITSIKQQAAPNLTQKINELEQKNEQLREQLENQKAERDRALQAAINEADGTGGTGVQGRGPIYEEKWRQYQQEKNEYEKLEQKIETKIAQNQKQLDNLREKKEKRVQQIVDAEQNADSLLTQLQALHDLAQNDPLVKWASVCLTLVLVSIDVFPILAKLFSNRGQYDYIVEFEELATTKRQEKKMNDLEEQVKEESNFERQISWGDNKFKSLAA